MQLRNAKQTLADNCTNRIVYAEANNNACDAESNNNAGRWSYRNDPGEVVAETVDATSDKDEDDTMLDEIYCSHTVTVDALEKTLSALDHYYYVGITEDLDL